MLTALILAASAATNPGAPADAPDAATLDMVPPFVGACMEPGPNADRIRAVVLKAGGKLAPQDPKLAAADKSQVQAYLFANGGAPYSVIFDKGGTCSVVAGRVDIEVTKSSLDRLVIGSSKVFDISQTEGTPHTAGESIVVEYLLSSKNHNGGLQLTLSKVTREDKGTAIFLTRRVVSASK
jgi:hypothetical protein